MKVWLGCVMTGHFLCSVLKSLIYEYLINYDDFFHSVRNVIKVFYKKTSDVIHFVADEECLSL